MIKASDIDLSGMHVWEPPFGLGKTAFIIENGKHVREVKIIGISGGIYTVQFDSESAIRVKRHRLFKTEEEAMEAMQNLKGSQPTEVKHGNHAVPLH